MENFEQWWDRVSTGIVLGHDNEKEIARKSWEVSLAQSRNYVASSETCPQKVTFANGRVVKIIRDAVGRSYLDVQPVVVRFDPQADDREALAKSLEGRARAFYAEQYGDAPMDLTEEEKSALDLARCKQCGGTFQHKMDCEEQLDRSPKEPKE